MDRLKISVGKRLRMVEIARRLRKRQTRSEELLWQALRAKRLDGWRFRRQQPIGPFVVDFFCPARRLVVEVDGPIHARQREADAERQRLIESVGFRLVRVTAHQVEHDIAAVLALIRSALASNIP